MTSPATPHVPQAQSPKELIEQSLADIAERVSLREVDSPSSHPVVVASGLDDTTVATSLARYAVGNDEDAAEFADGVEGAEEFL